MTPKEKCDELIEKFIPNMYCYMGSGMLSNDYDEIYEFLEKQGFKHKK